MPHYSVLFAIALLLAAAGEPPKPVRVATVAMQPQHLSLSFSGTVQARTEADLAFRVTGKVTQRPVEIGDHVRAGQTLATLDPADLQFSQESAEAALQAAAADAANAQADLRRYDTLGRSSPAYLPSEYDKRVAAQHMASARLIQAARQVALAKDQRSYGVLAADADGVVTALPVQVGQVVTAGQAVARVAHSAETEIVADVPENRLADIRTARDVTLTLWAAPGQAMHGRVREIGALADPASRTFAVKVTVLDPPADLLALGMTASVTFGHDGAPVAALPASALTDSAGHAAMWVLDPASHQAALRPVDVAGYGGDGSVLVRGGLSPGEQVVTAGVQQVAPGMALTAWAGAAR
jgi:multidrug efflux system membrane fusion protein